MIRLTQLLNEFLDEEILDEGVDDPGILKCVFMAGGPGSGKSYTAAELFGIPKKDSLITFAASGLKVVNSDPAFEQQLKKNGINPSDLAKIEKENPELWDKIIYAPDGIRNKAKRVSKMQQSFYEQGRLGMIVDGTGDDYAKIKKKKQHSESLGYDTYMVFVNTSLEVALERNNKRERVLPENLVKEIWNDVQQNLGRFQSLFKGNLQIVDNTVYGPIQRNVQKAVDRFIREPIQNHLGKKWIEQARALKNANLIKNRNV